MIELEGVSKVYRKGEGQEVRALQEVSLTIARGDLVAIQGPSGSGKTTLMNIIGCLAQPSSGAYRLDGQLVSALEDRALSHLWNAKIGFVFQAFHLLPYATALENVQLPLLYARQARASAAAIKAVEEVGLAHRMSHRPNELSGGEKQRVAIARALVNEPAVVLADEPTGNLDQEAGSQVMTILEHLNASGRTIVIVTHVPSIAAHARRIIRIRNGKLVED